MTPLYQRSKEEIKWMERHRCKHGHKYTDHQPCYAEEYDKQERVGFLDIETESLEADYGVIFTYCILDDKTGEIFSDTINTEDIKKWGKEAKEDTRLLKHLVEDLKKFDRIVGHYSSRFDLSYIRTRAVMCQVDFPTFGEYFQTDTWNFLKHKF
jgi:uncharacterized protein YprB with RNaseH-like and TPR domain